MKKTFLIQRFLQLSVLFAGSICFQSASQLNAESVADDNRLSTWLASNRQKSQQGLKNDDSSLRWLNDSSLNQNSYVANNYEAATKAGYHSPGQMLFPIEASPNPSQKTINGNLSLKKMLKKDFREPLVQAEDFVLPPGMQDVNNANDQAGNNAEEKTILINFPNISIIEYIRFISRLTNKNFIFDENDLQFYVTIISEEPATIENIMTTLLQELRIHDLTMFEQGNNIIIHRNSKVNAISEVSTGDISSVPEERDIVTQVFKLNTLRPSDIAAVIRPLTSEYALVEVLEGTNHLIITDIRANVVHIAKLIKSVDAPASGLVIGQYVVRTASLDYLIEMAKNIIVPISGEQPLTMVPWEPSGSIFVISTPFLVERTLSILQHLDQNLKSTKIFDLKELRYTEAPPQRGLSPPGLYINNEPYRVPIGGEIPRFPGVPRVPTVPPAPEISVPPVIPTLPGAPEAPELAPAPPTFPERAFPTVPAAPPTEAGVPEGAPREAVLPPERIPITPVTPRRLEFPEEALPTEEVLLRPGRWNRNEIGRWAYPLGRDIGGNRLRPPEGRWRIDQDGNWYFEPSGAPPRQGRWRQDPDGRWYFHPSEFPAGPGTWKQDDRGRWYYESSATPLEGGRWFQDRNGQWQFEPGPLAPREGTWKRDSKGKWVLEGVPGQVIPEELKEEALPAPEGNWIFDPINGWTFELERGEAIGIKRITRQEPFEIQIPLGAEQKPQFYIYKLLYRRGDTIQAVLQAIAESVNSAGPGNEAFLNTLLSVQWLEPSNSLIFTGLDEDLLKMRALMKEVDTPLRQVFIEVLILETSMNDSLEYGVTWGTRFGGGNWAGGESFSTALSPLDAALNQAGNPGGIGGNISNSLLNTTSPAEVTTANDLGTGLGLTNIITTREGLNLGVIGQTIINTSMGLQFHSIGALLHALRQKVNTDVILSPKIITEDNVPAEVFVGENIAFKTQSLANDNNNTITNNFEYRDVGTRLRVTPSIGNNNIISLEIAQEISRIIPSTVPTSNANNAPGPSTSKSTTTTRVHLPDGYFLIISGMMNDESDRFTTQIPCLGAIPILGGAFKDKRYDELKRNQMIFLRPKIIDTEEEIHNLTKHEQDIWDYKHRRKKDWIYETEELFEYLNLKREDETTDPEISERDT